MPKERGTPTPAAPRPSAGSGELGLYRRLLRQARPFGPLLAALFLLGLLAPPLDLLAPLPLALVVDGVTGPRPLPGPLGRLVPHDIARSKPALAALAAGLMIGIALARQGLELGASLLRTSSGYHWPITTREGRPTRPTASSMTRRRFITSSSTASSRSSRPCSRSPGWSS
jgi:hypothetical protein